jgi:hypothetical protein
MKWNQKDTFKGVDLYVNSKFVANEKKDKLFYHYTEWSGWRFWLKAIKHLDFPSMRSQIEFYFAFLTDKKPRQ